MQRTVAARDHASTQGKRPRSDSEPGPANTQRRRRTDAPLNAAFRSMTLADIFSNNTYKEFTTDSVLLRLLSKQNPNFKLIDRYIDLQYEGLQALKGLNATGTRKFAHRIQEFEENLTVFCRSNDGTLKKHIFPYNHTNMSYDLKRIFEDEILREFRAIRAKDGTIHMYRGKGRRPDQLPASEVPTFWKVELIRLPTCVLNATDDEADVSYEFPYLIMPGVTDADLSGLPFRYVYLSPSMPAHTFFQNMQFLEHVRLSDSSELQGSMFDGCTRLKYVHIPSDSTSIPQYCFQGCISLTEAPISNSVNAIGYGAFLGCSSIKTVNLPLGLRSIWEDAFRKCVSLRTIRLPKDLAYIGPGAFEECVDLSIVACENSPFFNNPTAFRPWTGDGNTVRKIKCHTN